MYVCDHTNPQPFTAMAGHTNAQKSMSIRRIALATATNITLANMEAGATLLGRTLAEGDIILPTAQTAPAENGPWQVKAEGAPVRPVPFNSWEEIRTEMYFTEFGSSNKNTLWACTSAAGGTLGTTALAFVKLSA